MIAREQVAELRNGPMRGVFIADCTCDGVPINKLLDTIEALYSRLEAAEKVCEVYGPEYASDPLVKAWHKASGRD